MILIDVSINVSVIGGQRRPAVRRRPIAGRADADVGFVPDDDDNNSDVDAGSFVLIEN